MVNVMVFPAGEINSVEIHAALSKCFNIKVFGASSIERHGKYIFENYVSGLPLITDEDFFSTINSVISKHNIKMIIPTHDTVAEFLSAHKDKLDCKLLCSNSKTSEICRDKELTYNLVENESFCPTLYKNMDALNSVKLPLFTKPKIGQGSVGARIIHSMEELGEDIFSENVVTEYLPGEEFTVDCFTSYNGQLKVVSPRVRTRTMAGVSVSGETVEATDEFVSIARTINEKLSFNGLWFFQVKRDNEGALKLLEISIRTAGTMCLSRAKGYNLPLMSVYNALEKDVTVIENGYNVKVDRTLISRYETDIEYDAVYFDYDDTIIINNKVNLDAIKYIYQLKNEGKKVILITRHEGDLVASLSKYHIAIDMFNEIIHLESGEKKSKYIKNGKSIFIDNAFSERIDVHSNKGIPVFDVDAIEVLLDWKS